MIERITGANGSGKTALMVFPSMFKGEQIKQKDVASPMKDTTSSLNLILPVRYKLTARP